ncbi:hypothetical protein [Methyloceanibacter sp.]|uniref:Flp family type IVb pilin n=1 Tax=Methyloceanibacter sp. TaxID=1965321 RepID=UPI0025CEB5F5|nr:hypothetical protein [Methyloceanibacter sp.]MCC0059548.1 hypothetical protein [Hyphomicrobiaceae bacterium]
MRSRPVAAMRRGCASTSGSVAMEYAVMAMLIAIGVLTAVLVLGDTVLQMYQTVAEAIARISN